MSEKVSEEKEVVDRSIRASEEKEVVDRSISASEGEGEVGIVRR